jgi:hypothetical protein
VLEVISRPQHARYQIDDDVVGAIVGLVWPGMPGIGIQAVLRDVDDRIVVEAAVTGAADAIVTGDKDLIDDADVVAWLMDRGISVLTPAELLALLEG